MDNNWSVAVSIFDYFNCILALGGIVSLRSTSTIVCFIRSGGCEFFIFCIRNHVYLWPCVWCVCLFVCLFSFFRSHFSMNFSGGRRRRFVFAIRPARITIVMVRVRNKPHVQNSRANSCLRFSYHQSDAICTFVMQVFFIQFFSLRSRFVHCQLCISTCAITAATHRIYHYQHPHPPQNWWPHAC